MLLTNISLQYDQCSGPNYIQRVPRCVKKKKKQQTTLATASSLNWTVKPLNILNIIPHASSFLAIVSGGIIEGSPPTRDSCSRAQVCGPAPVRQLCSMDYERKIYFTNSPFTGYFSFAVYHLIFKQNYFISFFTMLMKTVNKKLADFKFSL